MFIILVLFVLAAWGMIATVIDVRRDGYRQRQTDWSRAGGYDDPLRAAETSSSYR
jgi:hypothetical protein